MRSVRIHNRSAALSAALQSAFHATHQHHAQHIAIAPGRVNLIGEHTDYNDGFVLPCAIDFSTQVAVSARNDATVRVMAVDLTGAVDEFSLAVPIEPHPTLAWANHVRGMVAQLQGLGVGLRGANLVISGNVPHGAGLSSSASLALAVGMAMLSVSTRNAVSPTDLALAAQRSEHEFVGCHCGIMDQLASAHGVEQKALLIDCRSLAVQAVQVPESMAIMIVHSGVERGLVDSAYNMRRAQCEAASSFFGVRALRDVSIDDVSAARGLDAVALRRARHVVTENERTVRAAQALSTGDWPKLSELMAASHASLRDDFEVTVPPVDALVASLQAELGIGGGARMTGGGFGGCVVALMPWDRVEATQQMLARSCRTPKGDPVPVFLCKASRGAHAVAA